MAYYNKVILIGNLTRDPQLSYLPNQTPVVEFGLAVNRRWRSATGEQREEVCFVDCRCYGKQAETFNTHMTKGQSALIEGRLQLDTWEGQDGQKRSKHRIFVTNFQFMGAPRSAGGAPAGRPAAAPGAPGAAPPPPSAGPVDEEYDRPPEMPPGDDIPF
jgi:single-strand DNA-binding protein